MSSVRTLRLIAVLEATSFLALLVASIVRRTGGGAGGVHLLGPLHGILFLAYVGLVLVQRPERGWSTRVTVWLLVASILPFGGYVAEWWLGRAERSAR